MTLIFGVVNMAAFLFMLALIARMALDWVQVFSRDWEPQRNVRVVAGAVYSVTDPPLKFVSRFVPPLDLGSIRLDLGFMIVFFATAIVYSITRV